jgi:hypothetical protein
MNIVGTAQRPKQIAQFGIRFKRERVFALRAIQNNSCHSVGPLKQQVLSLITRQFVTVARQLVGLAG